MSMIKTVVFLCEEISHTKFFFNMEKAFQEINYCCIYLVLDLSVYFQLKKWTKNRVILLKLKEYKCNTDNALISKEYMEKSLSEKNVRNIYRTIYSFCSSLRELYDIKLFLCSQGIKSAEIAVRDFANENNIKVLFCELANLPNKVFFDIQGSNAKSFLYDNIQILDKYDVDDNYYEAWRKNYLDKNLKNHVVKQSVSLKKYSFKYGIISRLGYLYTGLKIRNFDFIYKLKLYLNAKKLNIIYDNFDIEKDKYIFFPMQVSNDSQIILNSDIGLFEGLKYAIEAAKEKNVELVVKLHPAEKDVNVILEILTLREKYKFKIVNINTFKLINNAIKVITINSTVALEAKIIGKEVKILGRSYYKFFNRNRIKNYIMGYLVDMDFFSEKPFDVVKIKNLLSKVKI